MNESSAAPTTSTDTVDCVVVGTGPAGLAAAQMLARATRSVLLLDSGEPVNAPTAAMHGVVGFDGAPPAQLREVGLAELATYRTAYRATEVVEVEHRDDGTFTVAEASGASTHARSVVLATSVRYDLTFLDGLDAIWGTRAAACPYCHGWEVRDQPLLLVGADEAVMNHMRELLGIWSSDLTDIVVGPGDRIDANPDGGVTLTRADGLTVSAAFAFVAAWPIPRAELLPPGCARTDDGGPVVDTWGSTSIPGLFAAGMLAERGFNVTLSLASGTRAGLAAGLWVARLEGRDLPLPGA